MKVRPNFKTFKTCRSYSIAFQQAMEASSVISWAANFTTGFCLPSTTHLPVSHLFKLTLILAADSNGVLIADFQPGKWNFLAIEHEKPFLARA
jgi:hypothetical protein